MDFHYKIKDEKLKKLVEKRSKESGTSIDDLIWGYINRGLANDGLQDYYFKRMHSPESLKIIDEVLGFL